MLTKRAVAALALLLGFLLAAPLAAQSVSARITNASQEQLGRWLRQYPEADANHDGVLTVEEADGYRQRDPSTPPG